MQRHGVEFIFNRHVVSATPEFTLLDDGTQIHSRTLVSTVPSSPNPLVTALGLKSDHGRLVTDERLLVADTDNVWSLGDCAIVPKANGGGICPPTAQFAVRQASTLAHNIVAALDGGKQKQFKFAELGKLAALGRRRAVGQLFGKINIHGFFAWIFWRTVYWAKLPGLDRKMRVAGSWLLEFLLPPDLVQTGLDRRRGLTEEFHEPGGYVFRQGEFGNRCYVIATGRAEIVYRDDDGTERVIAQLGPSDCFGASEVLQEKAYPASVRCIEATKLLVVDKDDFLKFADALPGLADRFSAINKKMAAAAAESQKDAEQADMVR
jgi:NADH dehydrogenase